ncbi:MAG: hypothetical protein FWD84_07485, partial [Oscillospiraceae bacterium]|nr:hypothetical protein [Oscillospiraceae bacterium]
MSRHFEKRDKVVRKMTRDGVVEQNLATGEQERISQRGQDFALRKNEPTQYIGRGRQQPKEGGQRRKTSYQNRAEPADHFVQPEGAATSPMPDTPTHEDWKPDTAADVPGEDVRHSPEPDTGRRGGIDHPARPQFTEGADNPAPPDIPRPKVSPRRNTKYYIGFRVEPAQQSSSPGDTPRPEDSSTPGKRPRLQFDKNEQAPGAAPASNKKPGGKADAAPPKFDQRRHNARRRLLHEHNPHTPGKKRPLPAAAGKSSAGFAAREASGQIHRKVSEVEHENVGVEAAHKAELAGE